MGVHPCLDPANFRKILLSELLEQDVVVGLLLLLPEEVGLPSGGEDEVDAVGEPEGGERVELAGVEPQAGAVAAAVDLEGGAFADLVPREEAAALWAEFGLGGVGGRLGWQFFR